MNRASVIIWLVLGTLSLAWGEPIMVNLQTIPNGARVYLVTSSSTSKGVFLGTSDAPLPLEQRYLRERGSLDLVLELDGYHPQLYNLKVLAVEEGAVLPLEGAIHLAPKNGGELPLYLGVGLIASLGIALAQRKPKSLIQVKEDEEPSRVGQGIDPFIGHSVCGFRLRNLVAKGGMGSLYYAEAEGREKYIAAVKIVDLHGQDEVLRERFMRELAVASRLHHPAIVRTWDYEMVEDRYLAIAMEWLPGEPLSSHMKENLTPKECLNLLAPVFEALAFLHDKGITHRDIKPGNIFVLPDRSCKLIDFGLAKDKAQATLTRTGMMVGTPKYMAPEQIRHDLEQGPGTDQYAMGLILYEMTTGQEPFPTDDPMLLIFHHLEDDPPLASDRDPTVSPLFAGVLARMIDREPGRRFPTIQQAYQTLREAQ